MNEQIKMILEELGNKIESKATMLDVYTAVTKIEATKITDDAVEPILLMIEKYLHFNWGNPGPFAHFLEALPNYESKLIESIKRKPTPTTLELLYRCINDKTDTQRDELIELMKGVTNIPDLDEETLAKANEFIGWINEDIE